MAPLASFHDIEHKAHPFDGRLLHFAKLNRKRHPLDDRPYGLWDSVHLLFWRSSGLRTARWDTTAAKRTPFLCSSAGKSLTPIIYSTCFHNTNATPPNSQFLAPSLFNIFLEYSLWDMTNVNAQNVRSKRYVQKARYISITLSWFMTNKKYFVEANDSSTSVGDTNSFAQIATYSVIKNKNPRFTS